ncbi:sugar phosphate isomerase/epimerase family protein [Tunicatimonas pelagia]|uniref:sugar phosphate isomerase/epimerase family protein n=1 Tax=Tunicatimonas pelagia TaxID=931531 RepID=UPI002665E38C|nr:sugar phosphate isomerase/epimerase [Tunicatimonas pelagia]WKN43542.1 sugar phosphate isomerase/epimerase [Tunicatimonas pelagia]
MKYLRTTVSRKDFLKLLGLSTAMATAPVASSLAVASTQRNKEQELTLGLASYTLRSLSLDEALAVAKRLHLSYIALKSMHLPLDSSPGQIKEAIQKVKDAGINLYGAGVIYMKSPEAVDNAFAYARAAGMSVIIGVPNPELLPRVEEKVKDTNIKLAIHNHGPGDKVYPSPDSIFEHIKDLDQRIGLCIDIGHTFRIGQDPAAKAKQYADRLYDVHLKDVDKRGAEGKPLEIGHGIMDIPAFMKTLQDINYTGVVGIEYEKDGDDPVPGLAESAGYIRGVLDGMSA